MLVFAIEVFIKKLKPSKITIKQTATFFYGFDITLNSKTLIW